MYAQSSHPLVFTGGGSARGSSQPSKSVSPWSGSPVGGVGASWSMRAASASGVPPSVAAASTGVAPSALGPSGGDDDEDADEQPMNPSSPAATSGTKSNQRLMRPRVSRARSMPSEARSF